MKSILTKLGLFFLGVLSLQLLRLTSVFPKSMRFDPATLYWAPNEALKKSLEQHQPIVYLGDSVLSSVSRTDRDQHSVGDYLAAGLSGCGVGSVSQPSSDVKLFRAFSSFALNHAAPPQAVITPINLRSFSKQWHGRPAYALFDEKYRLQIASASNLEGAVLKAFFRPVDSFRVRDLFQMTEVQFENQRVYQGEKDVGSVKYFESGEDFSRRTPQTLKDKFIYHYLYSLKPDHPLLLSLREYVDLFRSSRTKLILYLTPIDYESGDKWVGPEFAAQVTENIKMIQAVLAGENTHAADLSRSMEANQFSWGDIPNEHLNESGRRHLAGLVRGLVEKSGIACLRSSSQREGVTL